MLNLTKNTELQTSPNHTAPKPKAVLHYTPFGSIMVSVSKGEYRYGLNGMEKDNEMKGEGNSLDFGARIYDSRLGRWLSVDPLVALQPHTTPYKCNNNNPIIYIDPNGEAEFYYKGKWIGRDGESDMLIVVVKSKALNNKVAKCTNSGLNYTAIKDIKNGTKTKKYFVVHYDILKEANKKLRQSQTKEGEVGEFASTMDLAEGRYTVTQDVYTKGDETSDKLILKGDVSIHSHPTAPDKNGKVSLANEPSTEKDGPGNDLESFKNFKMNIIVGNNGQIEERYDSATGRSLPIDRRQPSLNFFNNNGKLIQTLGGEMTKNIEEDMKNKVKE